METVSYDVLDDGCPRHNNAPVRKTYTLGRYADAEITVFRCGCAVCFRRDLAGGTPRLTIHNSYAEATGPARLHIAMCNA